MLARGGVAYAVIERRCTAVHATPERRAHHNSLAGELWVARRHGKRRGKTSYDYQLQRGSDQLTLLGPVSTWSDASGFGRLCGATTALTYGIDAVELDQPHYVSLASCRAAIAAERTRLAWSPSAGPPPPGDPAALPFRTPRAGGC